MIRALILLTLAACAHSHSEEQKAEVAAQARVVEHAEEQSAASGRTAAGPETITTTVEEYAPPEVQPPAEPASAAEHPTVRPTAILRRTVTVDQRGPVDSSWMANSSGTQGAESQTSLKAASEAHSASSWKLGLPWLTLATLAAALALAWKTGWLGKGLGLLGKLF